VFVLPIVPAIVLLVRLQGYQLGHKEIDMRWNMSMIDSAHRVLYAQSNNTLTRISSLLSLNHIHLRSRVQIPKGFMAVATPTASDSLDSATVNHLNSRV
jgi:hypothetical protein